MGFVILPFDALENKVLYEILKLRFDVFVWEQNSLYDELDRIDYGSLHVYHTENGDITSYLRIYDHHSTRAHMGRIVVHPDHRGLGLGKKIVLFALQWIKENCPKTKEIRIGAQAHLEAYYNGFGFQKSSEVYDDGGVPHIEMTFNIS